MIDLDQILDAVLKREGGYSNHPVDAGGPTKYGITQLTLSRWLQRPVSESEVENLTREQAKEIFKVWYFDLPNFEQLPDSLWEQLLDCAVLHGSVTAVKLLQRSIRALGLGPIEVDGKIGPITTRKTLQAVSLWGPLVGDAVCDQRIRYIASVVKNRPTNAVFLEGWVSRALEFRSYWMEMS